MLWTRLRGRQLGGFKFVRQEPIDRYYVDFVCRERRLIIELDGGQHSERPEDGQRDSELSAVGYRVIRDRKIAPHPGPLPASGAREIVGVVIPFSSEGAIEGAYSIDATRLV